MATVFDYERWRQATGRALQSGLAFDSLVLDLKKAIEGQVPNGDMASFFAATGNDPTLFTAWPSEGKAKRDLPWLPMEAYSGWGDFADAIWEFELLYRSHVLYCAQKVVHAATIAEGMIINFLTAFFEANTDAMYSYTGHEGVKGQISLKVISQSRDLQELLNSLAGQAAARVFQQPYPKMLKTLQTLAGIQLSPSELETDLSKVFETRNDIVHSASPKTVSMGTSRTALWTIQKLAEHLLHVAMMKELPVSDESFDAKEREGKIVELRWSHEGQWPGEFDWVRVPDDLLRKEEMSRFGDDLTGVALYDRGSLGEYRDWGSLSRTLFALGKAYLEKAYGVDFDYRQVEILHPKGVDVEGFHFEWLSEEELRNIANGTAPRPEPPPEEYDIEDE